MSEKLQGLIPSIPLGSTMPQGPDFQGSENDGLPNLPGEKRVGYLSGIPALLNTSPAPGFPSPSLLYSFCTSSVPEPQTPAAGPAAHNSPSAPETF